MTPPAAFRVALVGCGRISRNHFDAIAKVDGLSMSAVSHQLAFLRHLKLVAAREEGRKSYYRVIDAFVAHLVHDCLAHVGGEPPGAVHHHPHRLAKKRLKAKEKA